MKKTISIICIIVISMYPWKKTLAQSLNLDSTLQKLASLKEGDERVEAITSLYREEFNNNPNLVIEMGLKLLKQSQVDKSIIEESSANSMIGHGYRLMGNNIKALDYHHKAIALAEKTGNFSLLAVAENQIGHIYKDREEYDKAIEFYQSSLANAEKGNIEKLQSWSMLNLSSVYLSLNKLDSSLKYAQRGYEIDLNHDKASLIFSYLNLAGVQSKSGNAQLAVSYYNTALKEIQGTKYFRYLNMIYTGLAQHYQSLAQQDSCVLYAKKAIAAVTNSPLFYLSNKPAQMLIDIYEKSNCDSALKYVKVFKTATDSLNSKKVGQQIQLLTFEENLRQQELASEKKKAETERRQNIQYALIAIGIIALLSLYLLLSRSFISNPKLIEFFGVIALLIVFEFLNLLLHPFLERITHHSPVLMLLALVCIAALLVPLHHKVEKWATSKLVEKNKQIRLAAAKKTIQQLDKDAGV